MWYECLNMDHNGMKRLNYTLRYCTYWNTSSFHVNLLIWVKLCHCTLTYDESSYWNQSSFGFKSQLEGFGALASSVSSSSPWSSCSPRWVRGIFCTCTMGDSSTGSPGSPVLVTHPLVCREGLAVALLVTASLVWWGSLASGLLAGDNTSGLLGESASTSAVGGSCKSELELDGDSSLLRGRGMDTLWCVLTWGLLWSQLKVAPLQVMGNLGLKTLVEVGDAAEQVLWGEGLSLFDLLSESLDAVDYSDVLGGLSMLILSSMLGVEGAGQVP